MPSAEIVSVGTELLLGQILNTNSRFISAQLADLGIDCLFQTTVGDNVTRIKQVIRQALNRSDVVITTGGLGPTADDLTHESLAELFAVPMQFDAAVLEHIRSIFAGRALVMSESNGKQAQRPQGSSLLPNRAGTAPGIIWQLNEADLERAGIDNPLLPRYILTFPGVPGEMKSMWNETARPFLRKTFGAGVIWSVDLKHYGIAESTLGEKYAHLLNNTNPTVAPLAGSGECRLRVSAKAGTLEEARAIAEPVVNEIKRHSSYLCYGSDDDTLESVVARLLVDRRLTVSVAESCTGGLLSKRLTDIAGSSAYVKLNVVTYSNEAKSKLLNVPSQLLDQFGAVSSRCAESMSRGARLLGGADIGIGITGIAGPDGGSADKPVGLVYLGLSCPAACYIVKKLYFSGLTRAEIRWRSASDALNMLRLYLINPDLLGEHYEVELIAGS